jgi:hypothetical protein
LISLVFFAGFAPSREVSRVLRKDQHCDTLKTTLIMQAVGDE